MSDDEPGPLAPLDLAGFGLELEPAAFAPLAQQLLIDLAPIHPELDEAHGVLEAETRIDVDGGTEAGVAAAGVEVQRQLGDDPALGELVSAQRGFEEVRQDAAIFASTFPAGYVAGSLVIDRRNPPPGNRGPGAPIVHPR